MSDNTRHHKLVPKQDERDETEKIYQENDKVQDKIQRKFACLGLTWRGLILLLALGIAFIILLIIIIALAITLALNQKHNSNICKTPECLRTSANIVEKMDQTVNPCEDFYEFSCGKWKQMKENNYAIATSGRVTQLDQLMRDYYAKIRDLLNTLPYMTNVTSVEWKMKNFYSSCMNMESIEAASIRPLRTIIDQLYGWNVLGTFIISQWNNNYIIRRLHIEYDVNPFFKPIVSVNDNLAKIEIMPSGFGLPNKKYYFRAHFDKVVKAYKSLMHDSAVLFGATGTNAKIFADQVFSFETRLAQIFPDIDYRTRLRYPQEMMTVAELNSISRQIDWIEYLNTAFPGFTITDTTMIYGNKTYLEEVSNLISSATYQVLNNYIIWLLVRQYSPYLSKDFQTLLDNFQNALTGSTQAESRWEFCIKEVEKLFPIGIGALYVDNFVSTNEIENIKIYFKHMKETFLSRINDYDWMDEKSKQKTKENVKKVLIFEKFPFGINSSKVIQHYLNLMILKSDFFYNILKSVAFHNILAIKLLKGQVTVDWQRLHYYEQRAPFITLSRKYLVIPYYFLTEPTFDSKQFMSLNFGAIGWLMGRAIIQGFENADIVNKNWALPQFSPNWWSNYTCEKYEKHQNCIINEYSKNMITMNNIDDDETENGIHFDALTTQDENMADIGGLTLAYNSFVNWESKHSEEKYLPAFPELTKKQLFFLSYGQTLCSELKQEIFSDELDGNKFSPNRLRVNQVVSQIPEFSHAFSCCSSSRMNSEHKCNTW